MTKKPAQRLPFPEFQFIYSRVPRLCVDLVIKDKRGVVLSQRDIPPAKGQWHLPGGTVLYGEKLADAVARVAQEETGLQVAVRKVLGVIEYSKENAFGQSIGIAFLVHPQKGKLRGSNQAKKILFFSSIPPGTISEQKSFLEKNRLV